MLHRILLSSGILLCLGLSNVYGQEKIQERLIEIHKEIKAEKNPKLLIDGRDFALKSIEKYGDNRNYFGLWAWLAYFNAEICIKNQMIQSSNIGGYKGKENLLLKEGEDALNKSFILAESDNEFEWKYPGKSKSILSRSTSRLILAYRNQIIQDYNESDSLNVVEEEHGHFDWILDYSSLDWDVKDAIQAYNDRLAEILFGAYLVSGDTLKAYGLANQFINEKDKSFYKAYIKLLQKKPEDAIRIFSENDRRDWFQSDRSRGCIQFITLYLQLGYDKYQHLQIMVDGFLAAGKFKVGDHKELGDYLAMKDYFKLAEKVYESGILFYDRAAQQSKYSNTRLKLRKTALNLIYEEGIMFFREGLEEYNLLLSEVELKGKSQTVNFIQMKSLLAKSSEKLNTYKGRCIQSNCHQTEFMLSEIDRTLQESQSISVKKN